MARVRAWVFKWMNDVLRKCGVRQRVALLIGPLRVENGKYVNYGDPTHSRQLAMWPLQGTACLYSVGFYLNLTLRLGQPFECVGG